MLRDERATRLIEASLSLHGREMLQHVAGRDRPRLPELAASVMTGVASSTFDD